MHYIMQMWLKKYFINDLSFLLVPIYSIIVSVLSVENI
ncbi:putative membrane protein [Candidatus Neoehrlichia lotoris str. RAC413]|uniref:Putative membrane protein n=1 Tax=Candidatus Neoehrlichia procyonis str. RAC413 TaxID=1359163 RepID=A0A0F3NPP5_9RICK|nr:putative membrane protein [Candidatus Neoehrlichia lotoris str. RAC413]